MICANCLKTVERAFLQLSEIPRTADDSAISRRFEWHKSLLCPISYVYNMEMLHIIKQYKGFPVFLEE